MPTAKGKTVGFFVYNLLSYNFYWSVTFTLYYMYYFLHELQKQGRNTTLWCSEDGVTRIYIVWQWWNQRQLSQKQWKSLFGCSRELQEFSAESSAYLKFKACLIHERSRENLGKLIDGTEKNPEDRKQGWWFEILANISPSIWKMRPKWTLVCLGNLRTSTEVRSPWRSSTQSTMHRNGSSVHFLEFTRTTALSMLLCRLHTGPVDLQSRCIWHSTVMLLSLSLVFLVHF